MGERDRWAALFADLSAEFEGEEARERDDEVRDRTRAEHSRIAIADRLAAHDRADVVVRTPAGPVRGPLTGAAPDWLLVGETLVPRTAILTIGGLTAAAREPDAAPRGRLPIGYALRVIARERAPVVVTLVDGSTLTGPIDRVGRDHVDVGGQAVPYRAVATVRPA